MKSKTQKSMHPDPDITRSTTLGDKLLSIFLVNLKWIPTFALPKVKSYVEENLSAIQKEAHE